MVTKTKKDVYLKDKVVNILLTDIDTREYTESIIAATLNIPKEIVKDNLVLLSPRVNENINTQYSMVDALYENNTSIINIEVNYVNYREMHAKNMKYVCHLLLKQTKINDKHIKLKPIYQICINNFDMYKENKFIYRSSIMEEKFHKKRNDFINIIDLNMDFLNKVDYNLIMKEKEDSLERLLYVLVCNDKEVLDKLYRGDNIMDKVREKLSSLTDDFMGELYYDKEEIINNYSYDLGKEEGKEESAREIAKNLLDLNIPIDNIKKATGLTKEEIEELKNK